MLFDLLHSDGSGYATLVHWWGDTLSMAQQKFEEIGPSWRFISTTVITILVGGTVTYMTYTANLMQAIEVNQSAQQEQINQIKEAIAKMETKAETATTEAKEELKEQREDIKEINKTLNSINVKLARTRQ